MTGNGRRPVEGTAGQRQMLGRAGLPQLLGAGSGAADDPAFTTAGEPMSARERAARLDEGLELLTALWTGEPVHHHGRYYRLDGLHLPAVPVQRPRIPVWIGGDLSRPGTRRRLTRWDGACVYRDRALEPGDVRDIAALLREAGRDLTGYDIKVSGNPHQLAEFAAAGATWWGEWIPPGEPAGREENPMTPTQPAT